MLLWTFIRNFLCSSLFSVLFSVGYSIKEWNFGVIWYSIFNFLRKCQSVFQSSCIILHPYQNYMRASVSLHPCQHLLLFVFFIITNLASMKWYLMVDLICISLMNNGECLFKCLLVICIFSLGRCLFTFWHF